MTDSLCILAFTPVPARARCDGWSCAVQRGFVEGLAAGMTPGAAARSVGMGRQGAYALRRRPGAESFAAAWDAAAAFAARQRAARRTPAPVRPRLPTGPAAEAIGCAGRAAVFAARSDDEARSALGTMLDALYGPKADSLPPPAPVSPPPGREPCELSAAALSLSRAGG